MLPQKLDGHAPFLMCMHVSNAFVGHYYGVEACTCNCRSKELYSPFTIALDVCMHMVHHKKSPSASIQQLIDHNIWDLPTVQPYLHAFTSTPSIA